MRSFVFTIIATVVASFVLLTSANSSQIRSQLYSGINDDFAGAISLSSSPYLSLGHFHYASREVGEAKIFTSSKGRTVWYKYLATLTGRAVVTLASPSTNYLAPYQIAAYKGTTLATLVRLDQAQIAGTTTSDTGSVAFDTIAGQLYYIQIDTAPQSSTYQGYFLIGLRQFAPAGGVAIFAQFPLAISYVDQDKRALVVNGHRVTTDLQYSVLYLGTSIGITVPRTTLAPKGAVWAALSDNDLATLPQVGSNAGQLSFITRTTTGTILGSATLPLYGIRPEFSSSNPPKVFVRFAAPGQGVRATEKVSSTAVVKNISAVNAVGCTFVPRYDVATLYFYEILANGSAANINAPFDLAAGQTRRFMVSEASLSTSSDAVVLRCANYYAAISGDDLASLWSYSVWGISANVRVTAITGSDFYQLPLGDFEIKKLLVRVWNLGKYSGVVDVNVDDDTYLARAVVDSLCESTTAGVCVGPSGTSSISVDLAAGEYKWLTLNVRRGNDTASSGIVNIGVETGYDESPSSVSIGYGGFEIVRKP